VGKSIRGNRSPTFPNLCHPEKGDLKVAEAKGSGQALTNGPTSGWEKRIPLEKENRGGTASSTTFFDKRNASTLPKKWREGRELLVGKGWRKLAF